MTTRQLTSLFIAIWISFFWTTGGATGRSADCDAGWFCDFTNDQHASGTWVHHHVAALSETGIQGDVATLRPAGGRRAAVTVGRLLSAVYGGRHPPWSVTFTYNLSPNAALSLKVKEPLPPVEQSLNNTVVFTGARTGQQSTCIEVTTNRTFQLVFEGRVDPAFPNDHVTLGDVSIQHSSCQNHGSINCTFDDGTCGYLPGPSGGVAWKRGQGRVADIRGPPGDHTSGNGYYLYVDYTRKPEGRASISTPLHPAMENGTSVCLSFWYHMFGGTSGTLNIYVTAGGSTLPVWSRSGSQANVWRKGWRTVTVKAEYQFTFEAVIQDKSSVVVALDDVLLTTGRCPTEPMCDFEADLCDLTSDGSDVTHFRWERGKNGTYEPWFGPEVDHTTGTGNGHFMITVRAPMAAPGDSARLIMRPYRPRTATQCGHFWYYMNGDDVGALHVYIRRKSVADALSWTGNGNRGREWIYGQVSVEGTTEWQLTFEAVTTAGPRAAIALDDIRVTEGACPAPASCDFERDMCGYSNWRNDGYTWLRTAGQSLRGMGGPKVDHTTNSDQGFYVVTEGSLGSGGQRARLLSEIISPANIPSCLTFWYHTYDSSQSQLIVSMVPSAGPTLRVALVDNSPVDSWQRLETRLQYSESFRILFESVEGPNGKGLIAVDDISYTPNVPCGVTPTSLPPTTMPTTSAPSVYDCTFDEKTLCSWKNGPNTDSTFKLMTGLENKGPKVDHSSMSAKGFYIIFREHYLPANKTVRIQSPQLTTSGQNLKCFRFWYHIFGPNVNRLNIRLNDMAGTLGDPIWRRVGTAEDRWTSGQVLLDYNGTYSVVVEAVSGENWSGDIAVDDLKVTEGPCPTHEGVCDFEAVDQCGYLTDTTLKVGWRRGRGSTGANRDVPPTDHTYGTVWGHYMYVTSSADIRDQRVLLFSPTYGATTGRCLRYWYRVEGKSLSSLRAYVHSQGRMHLVWRDTGQSGDEWRVAQITLNSNSPFQVVYETIIGGLPGSVALDDITLTTEACPQPASCDFETDMCTFSNDLKTDFQWLRHRGDALTPYVTGPPMDHTLGTPQGWYMFMDVNRGHGKGDVGRFRSALLPATTHARCLSFWYLVSGTHPGTLRVYTESFPSKTQRSLVEISNTNSGGVWLLRRVTLDPSAETLAVVFQGETGYRYKGSIAVDDIEVSEGRCPQPTQKPPMFECGDGTTVRMDQVCDFHVDCPNSHDEADCGNCTFEGDTFCSWKDTSQGSFKWVLGSGSTQSNNRGPATDHTLGTDSGKYAYVDGNVGNLKALATLESRALQLAGSSCKMTLWYAMYGADIGNLQVSVKLTNTAQKTVIWHKRGQQGPTWLRGNVQLPRITIPYTILVEAERSFSTQGHIAIDDVSLRSCGLPPVQPGPCEPGYKPCHRHSCYQPLQECDFTDDCGDFTDEMDVLCGGYPSRCDFEYGLCGWTTNGEREYRWRRGKGSTHSVGTGPTRDHTSGLVSGSYVFTDASRSRVTGEEAKLISPTWEIPPNATETHKKCYMTFYYHMLGVDIGELKIFKHILPTGTTEKLFSIYGDQGDIWNRGIIFLDSSQPFVVEVISIKGDGYQGDIALDDITFSPGCVLYTGPPITPPPTTIRTTPPTTLVPCPGGWRHCRNTGQCVRQEDFCNFHYDCSDGSDEDSCPQTCTFEEGTLCHWVSSTQGKMDWMVSSGARLKETEGPLRDHTLNSKDGKYAYLNNAYGGSVAKLQSPMYQQSGTNCKVSFWYNVNGSSTLTLDLLTNGAQRQLWILKNDTDTKPKWSQVNIKLPVCSTRFNLLLKGDVKTQGGIKSFIAIDDIRFDSCEYPPPVPQCTDGQFRCRSGHCVPAAAKCDFQTDCCDGSDEEQELCKKYQRCDFENGFCDFKRLSENNMEWNYFVASEGPGPRRDHTFDNRTGHYISVQSPATGVLYEKARLAYNLNATDTSSPCRLRLWYHISHQGTLAIYQRTSIKGRENLLKITNTAGGTRDWSLLSVNLLSNVPYQIIIEGAPVDGSVSIDDVSFTEDCIQGTGVPVTPAPTPPPPCEQDQFTCSDGSCVPTFKVCDFTNDCPHGEDESSCPSYCDFEKGNCGWKEMKENGFDWLRGSGSETKDTPKVAPRLDHTLAGQYGHYMYLKSDTGVVVKNKQNLLLSALYKKALAPCKVQFFYYIDGIATGTVNLAVKRQNKTDLLLWSTKKSVDSKWRFIKVGLGMRQAAFQVAIWRDPTYRYQGIVAVDDIRFTGCATPPAQVSCSSDRFWCTSTRACISSDKLCDLEDDCGDTSDEDFERCYTYIRVHFEGGLQIFKQGRTGTEDDFDWTLGSGATATRSTGPSFDHTTGRETGKYVYINSRNQKFGEKAWLVSEAFQPTVDGTCRMRLWYHMYGVHVNRLAVYFRFTRDGAASGVLWERQGPVGPYWERADFNLVLNNSFQIIIEATVGDWRTGDIAIDDISFTPSCRPDSQILPTVTAPTPTPTTRVTTVSHACDRETQFNCHNSGKCIPRNRVCDFRVDCVDGSDESRCTRVLCTFEKGELCNWAPQQTRDHHATYRWQATQAGAPSAGKKFRPEVDHTTGRATGWYLWADSSPGERRDRATLWSTVISRTGTLCKMTFWYHMAGFYVGSLHVMTDTRHSGTHQLWYQSGPRRDAWQLAEVFIGPRTDFWVVIEARRGRNYQGDISIDDVSFGNCEPLQVTGRACTEREFRCDNGFCLDKQYVCDYANHCEDNSDEERIFCDDTYVYRCDFEFNICPTWHQDRDDDFDWTLTQGGNDHLATGPQGDHTTGKGSYLFIETTYSVKKGDLARLSSNYIKGSSKNCQFRFWYHMKGDNIGSLSVLMRYRDKTDSVQNLVLYNVTGEQGELWERGVVNLSPYIQDKADFQVVLQASVGGRARGDIALDDLSLTPGCDAGPPPSESPPTTPPSGCDPYSFRCKDGGCFHQSQRCNFIKDCEDGTDEKDCGGDCDFEGSDLCGWTNSYRSTLDWLRRSGPTPTRGTGPSADHTRGDDTGHYMYVEANAVKAGDRGHLQGAIYRMTGAKCRLTFWFHMLGPDIGRLTVYIKSKAQSTATAFQVAGNQGDKWKKADVFLGHRRNFALVFEAVRGGGTKADIALDDIKFVNCASDTKLADCRHGEFLCSDQRQCIQERRLCDRRVDCRDGSDENLKLCPNVRGNCDFEANWRKLCGWRQAADDDADWYQGALTPAPGTGPRSDHTVGRGGHFLYIDSLKMDAGEVARVLTPEFPASYGACYVRFWYHMFGDTGMGTLQVYTRSPAGQRGLLWTRSGPQGDAWQYAIVSVGSNQNFSLVFEAQRGNSLKSDIALDDVTFTPSCVTGHNTVLPSCKADEFYCGVRLQCLPRAWQCDGEVDCPDGSDEKNCTNPIVSGSTVDPRRFWTVSAQTCERRGHFRCSDGACIPANLHCDGVPDCQQGDDEFGCRRTCHREVGETYCRPTSSCLPPEYRCDNQTNCPDGSDEAACSDCPEKFCLNGGRCWVQERFGSNCNCSGTGYDGYRCQYKLKTAASPKPSQETHEAVTWLSLALGIGCGLLLIVCVGLSIYISQIRRQRSNYNRHSHSTWDNGNIDNPVYDATEMQDNHHTFNNNHTPEPGKASVNGKRDTEQYHS